MSKEITFKKLRGILVSIIRQPYTWPGGYEKLIVTHDGGLLCSQCCRKEAVRIMADIRDGYDTGWLPTATTYEAVSADCCADDLKNNCSHCSREFGELGA